MRRAFRGPVATSFLVAVVGFALVQANTLCSLPPVSYTEAKTTYPASAFAIEALEKYAVAATWYSDRTENDDYAQVVANLVAFCPEDSRISVVIDGLPKNEIYTAKESALRSTVHSAFDYTVFLKTLTSAIGNRKVLYILEPDAIGLLAKNTGCGQDAGFLTHLQTAVDLLSQNVNADIYLDVSYVSLQDPVTSTVVAQIVKQLASTGPNVKGIMLNTSNYQSTSTLATLCSNFQAAVNATDLHCIFDTSRNYYGGPVSNEWCNVKSAGMGALPTSETGIDNVDYFVWAKSPGESDGPCDGRTSDSMQGPGAGIFFDEMFQSLWNQGIMVAEKGYSTINNTGRSSSVSSSLDQLQEQNFNKDIHQDADKYLTTTPSFHAISHTNKGSKPSIISSTTHTSDPKTTEAPIPPASKTFDSQQLSTARSDSNHTMGSGVILLIALVTTVVLAVIAGIRYRHKKILTDAKIPALAPLPTTIVNFQPAKMFYQNKPYPSALQHPLDACKTSKAELTWR